MSTCSLHGTYYGEKCEICITLAAERNRKMPKLVPPISSGDTLSAVEAKKRIAELKAKLDTKAQVIAREPLLAKSTGKVTIHLQKSDSLGMKRLELIGNADGSADIVLKYCGKEYKSHHASHAEIIKELIDDKKYTVVRNLLDNDGKK